ncbi:MAG TPA: hypothetical protein VFV98_12780, partial [Vicinamibacterales bacterium]|nr:hypothetical protein [Vicinamibacterales bacterium]
MALVVKSGDRIVAATSTEIDGTYRISLPPNATYQLGAELTAFAPVTREITIGGLPCTDTTADLAFTLASRVSGAARPAGAPTVASATTPASGAAGRGSAASPGASTAPGQPRFETLTVQTGATAAAALEVNPPEREAQEAATRLLLPPGFSMEGPTEAVAMNGNMASVDRGMLNDRLQAIGRGDFDPVTGEFRQPEGGVAEQGGRGGPGGPGGRGGPGGPGGPGGRGQGGPGGPVGPGGRLGGRGVQQRLYQITSNYGVSGSAFDSAPYQLRSDNPVETKPYTRQNFGITIGGPVKLPGYDGTRRTNFQINYAGNRGSNLFDQYATVPTLAVRNGDFSSLSTKLIDPATGLPFPNNVIPRSSMNSAALALLPYIPEPNLSGNAENFHFSTTTQSVS